MKLIYYILSISVLLSGNVLAQSALGTDSVSELPKAFLISEDDNAYSELVSATPTLLLDVCNGEMDYAYKKWMYMLADLEEFAESVNFDVKGLKIWINVFFNPDGSIAHIVYYPKPTSKNIEYSTFTNLLNSFSKEYQIDLMSNKGYVHYGSASFPTFVKQIFPERNK